MSKIEELIGNVKDDDLVKAKTAFDGIMTAKIDAAMNKGKESWYTLKNKIPVYIGYFTAWVDNDGTINFYKDIYERDEQLAAMLLEE